MLHPIRRFLPLLLSATLGACAGLPRLPLPAAGGPSEYRIFDVAAGSFVDLDRLTTRVASADVLLFGEVHDDVVTHRVQHALLRRLDSSPGWRVLGMEMFERDVQPTLTRFLEREIGEDRFLAEARPWPNYATDYRPLVEEARLREWTVAATNLPQSIASAIAREGLDAVRRLDLDARRMAATVIDCPQDAYWDRFVETIFEGADVDPSAHMVEEPMLRRMYDAQCTRDETMAETIVNLMPEGRILHVNGAFHSDFRLGIVPRLLRREPAARVFVISAIPTDDLTNPPIAENLDRADFLIFTAGDPD